MAPDEIQVLYEDEWLLAANKPGGLLVHADGTGAASLSDLVRERLAAAGDVRAQSELQAVQRLDVGTTGIVLFSKRKDVQARLDALVAAHEAMRKRYLAIVRGQFPGERQDIALALGRDRHDARRMRVSATGKPCLTHVRLLASAGTRAKRVSLVEATLATGRKHQIRVHLASVGTPIVGDALYGVPADRRCGAGLMLHAASLDFVHPVMGEAVSVRAPYPQRFCSYFPEGAATAQ